MESGDGPEAVFLHRRQRVWLKVEHVAVFAAQRFVRVVEACLHVDRNVHRISSKAADDHQCTVIILLTEADDGIARESESAVLHLEAACAYCEFRCHSGQHGLPALRRIFAKHGAFTESIGIKYQSHSLYLGRGDILVTKTNGHTVVVLSNGSKYEGVIQYTLGDRMPNTSP